jgi:alanine transaminase
MKRENIENIISVCHQNEILIMADEVYQNNIYKEGAEFISFRKVLSEMGAPYNNETELISMHSVSKGLMGECGLRGGYMETKNLSSKASDILYKLKSIELCSNTAGQLAIHLMVNPPSKGVESDRCVEQFLHEKNTTQDGLKKRALLLTECFNAMKQVSCTEIEGAMYAFPQVRFS